MKRLVIAVDCDDVLVPSTKLIVDIYNQQYGTSVRLEGAQTSKNPEWQASREEIAQRIYDIQLTDQYTQAKPFSDAVEACRRLATTHELHLVTARPDMVMPVTMAMLEKYFADIFTEIEHVGLDGSKGEVCQRLQADILIDDNYKHLEAARECGLECLLWFGDYPWQGPVADELVMRCRTWQEVEQEIDRVASH